MPGTVTSPNMGIVLPVNGITPSPTWGATLQAALFATVDAHDHSTGKGVKITPTGLNINTDLTFNSTNALALRTSRYTSQSAPLTAGQEILQTYVVGHELYYNDDVGNQVKITNNGAVNATGGTGAGATTTASFVQPAVGSTVVVHVSSVATLTTNTPTTVQAGGNYICTALNTGALTATLLNMGGGANGTVGSTIGSGSAIASGGSGAPYAPSTIAEGQASMVVAGLLTPVGAKRTVNVQSFGAKGDGVTDDSGAFQAALAAAYLGGNVAPELWLPCIAPATGLLANYFLAKPVFNPFGVKITGEGSWPVTASIASLSGSTSSAYPLLQQGQTMYDPQQNDFATNGYRNRSGIYTAFLCKTVAGHVAGSIVQNMDMGFSTQNNWWDLSALGGTAPSTFTSTWVTPAANATVAVVVTATGIYTVSGFYFVPGAGRYTITAIADSTHMTIKLLSALPGVSTGTTIAIGVPLVFNGFTAQCFVDPVTNTATNEKRIIFALAGSQGNASAVTTALLQIQNIGSGINQVRSVVTVPGGIKIADSTTLLTAGALTHVAMVYNGIDLRLFVGGVLQGSPTACTGAMAQTAYEQMMLGLQVGIYLNGALTDAGAGLEIGSVHMSSFPMYFGSFTAPTVEHPGLGYNDLILLNFSPANIPTVAAPAGYTNLVGSTNLAAGWVIAKHNTIGNNPTTSWLIWSNGVDNYVNGSVENVRFVGSNATCAVLAPALLNATLRNCVHQGARFLDLINFSYECGIERCLFSGAPVSALLYSWGVGILNGAQFFYAEDITPSGFNWTFVSCENVNIQRGYVLPGVNGFLLCMTSAAPEGTKSITVMVRGISFFDDGHAGGKVAGYMLSNLGLFVCEGGEQFIGLVAGDTGPIFYLDGVAHARIETITNTINTTTPITFCTSSQVGPVKLILQNNDFVSPIMPETGNSGQGPVIDPDREAFGIHAVDATSGSFTMLVNDYRHGTIDLTGTPGAGFTVTTPPVLGYTRTWLNATAQIATITTGAGNTVTVPAASGGHPGVKRAVLRSTGWEAAA